MKNSSLAYLAIFFFLTPSVYWIAQDLSVWRWDQAWYGEVSADLWFTLLNHPAQWWPAMWMAFGSKAPGIAWIGQWFVPIGQILGSIEVGLLLSIIIFQFGTLLLIYKVGKEFLPDGEFAFLGCLMLLSGPLFVGMTHQYFAEPIQLFAVTYLYWIASRARYWKRTHAFSHISLAAGLGLASKVTFPLYCLVPGCIAVYDAVKGERPCGSYSSSFSWRLSVLVLAGAAVLGNACIWYGRNASAVIDFVKLASSSEDALHYGSSGTFLHKIQYWLEALQKSLAVPSILLGLAVVLLIGAALRRAGGHGNDLPFKRLSLLAGAAVAHLVLVLTIFSFSVNEEQRYLLPLLPSVIVIFLWVVSFVRMRLVLILLASLFLAQWAYVEARALGYVADHGKMSHWVVPLQRDGEMMNELSRLIELTCTPATARRYNIVGVDLPWLNHNSMSFYTAKRKQDNKLRCYYTSLGYAETDVSKAWKRVNDFNIRYFVSLQEAALPQSFLNQVSVAVLRRIQVDSRFTPVPYNSCCKVLLFRKNDTPVADQDNL